MGLKTTLKTYWTAEYWPYWLAAFIILLLIILGYYYFKHWRGRKKKKEAKKGAEETKEIESSAGEVEEKERKVLGSMSLRNIWKDFIRGIPSNIRKFLPIYSHFVVMGKTGSGKSELIDRFTDWQGQARQFYPSYTTNPLLQLYLGSTVMVEEIPAPLLNDTTKEAREAFLNLWKPVFKKTDPKVVVTIDGGSLEKETPESLKTMAQMIRGKMNIISGIRKKPIEVVIALTHMDRIEGFTEFFNFLAENQLTLDLKLNTDEDIKNLPRCLEPYESYLSRALTTQNAENYLKLISFLRQAPNIFSTLTSFIRILQQEDPFSEEPKVVQLCLTSNQERDRAINNPFSSRFSPGEIRQYNPNRKHQIAAGVLAAAGVLYLVFGYFYQRNQLIETDRSLQEVEQSMPERYNENMHRLFQDFSTDLNESFLMALLPEYFPNATENIRQRLVNNIRSRYLLPYYENLRESQAEDVQHRALLLLALLYSSNDNQLGNLVMNNIDKFSTRLGFPEMLISDYVKETETSWKTPVEVDFLEKREITQRKFDPEPWIVYFNEIKRIEDRSYITPAYMESLREKAKDLLEILTRNERNQLSAKITDLLVRESPVKIERDWFKAVLTMQLSQQVIGDFLDFILTQTIQIPSVEGLSFGRLLEHVKVIGSPKFKKRLRFDFYLGGEDFSFSAQKIQELTIRSRLTLFLRDFIEKNSDNDGLFFFPPESDYPDIIWNAGSSGLFFVGEAKIDGRFTKKAFDEEVKPSLLEFSKIREYIPIRKDEQIRFTNFVIKSVEAYAKRYGYGFKNYYDSFRINAEFPGALRYALTEMQLPSSQFQEFLFTIKDNTSFELEPNPFLKPFIQQMKDFQSFQRLLREDKGAYPELEKYNLILSQLKEELENREPFVPENEEEPANALKMQLSPLGRICLSVFLMEENSHYNMIKLWADNVGIAPRWRRLFFEPVMEAYQLGQDEVEKTVAGIWNNLNQKVILPIYQKFPFDVLSDRLVSAEFLEETIHPTGEFWMVFNSYLRPVMAKIDGEWQEKPSRFGVLTFPRNMISTVNQIERLTQTLWDHENEPKPIRMEVKNHLLPQVGTTDAILLLTYLSVGPSSVYSFNQKSSWHELRIEWWKRQPAAVGIEFMNNSDMKKAYKDISLAESEWSFFRLLRKGRTGRKNLVEWEIPRNKPGKKPFVVQYTITPDPWKIIRPETNSITKKDYIVPVPSPEPAGEDQAGEVKPQAVNR